ncbi:excisionase family DNA-binding protein [Speluncibacter jeojiensis]|uniref:Excisionase family DNA-binding protein n=1 Tax=Speluncibacter jeojiensis TaxID=2710754 RepID=A0A9X4M1T8_9ACTN|nr:excisionase family DNA-binding protein [Corynebacteriales bacterium D3-21]
MPEEVMTVHAQRGKRDRRSVSEQANQALRDLNQILNSTDGQDVAVEVDGDDHVVRLPREVAQILREVLASTAAGQAVAVFPRHAELTTQQAADLLNVSRPFLIKLLDDDKVEYRMVGTHRRITAASLERYRREMEHGSLRAADELAELTEAMGLYE